MRPVFAFFSAFFLLPLLCSHAASPAPPPSVAVLLEPGLPAYSAPVDLPPSTLLKLLEHEGIAAKALTVDELANPQIFNAKNFSVLVMGYGTVYPLAAISNVRNFRSEGGCLVTSGYAFYNAYEKTDKGWNPVSNKQSHDHGPTGVGTGIYQTVGGKGNLAMDVPGNPLLFTWKNPTGNHTRNFWLDERSLPKEDKVLPLLTIRDEGGNRRPAAALVRHKCKEFRGACDVWLGTFHPYSDITDRNVIERIFCAGVLWCLKEKGCISDSTLRTRLQAVYSRPPIAELPTRLAYKELPRPWGEDLMPKSKSPARKLLVVDTGKVNKDESIALTCLQGLTAREQPRIWLHRAIFQRQDRDWLEQHKAGGHIDGWEDVADWKSLFKQFKEGIRGAVIADPGLYRGDLVAVNVAMCEDLIVATPELAKELELPVKLDLRGRFKTYAEAMRWVWATYRGKFNPFVCDYMWPARLSLCVFDYAYQWRAPLLWPAGPLECAKTGADPMEEYSLVANIMAQMAPQSVVMGFPAEGEVGIGEPAGVQLASRYGRGLVCTNAMANFSVMSGVRLPRMEQKWPAPPKLDPTKIYVSMTASDGDNLNCWYAGFFRRYFEHPAFGTVPVAFTMGPALNDLAPVMARWFYDRATPNTEFICGVAGATYVAPSDWGSAYTSPQTAWAGFLKWTSRTMANLDMRTLNITPGGRGLMESYSRGLPACHSLTYGWRRDPKDKLPAMAYLLPTGMPGFDSALIPLIPDQEAQMKIDRMFPAKKLVADFEAIPKSPRPLFLSIILENWAYDMNNVEYIGKNSPADVVFVSPSQLANLYLQSKKR